MVHIRTVSLAACCVMFATLALRADTPSADPNKPVVDEDFVFQGEYYSPGRGLQVVALGDGKFDAIEYPGGLPGNGWSGGNRRQLSGERAGSGVILVGETGSITLVDKQAYRFSDAGHGQGTLRKVLRTSSSLGAKPVSGAKVLFDGSSLEHFQGAKFSEEGNLLAGALTKEPVGDFRLHLEFRTPYKPQARGQGRGNSGVYIQERYEVQVLDSFGLPGEFNEAGALYRQRAPDFNMAFPPLTWQTYDIFFRAARWDEAGKKKENARLTLYHNGVIVHRDVSIPGKTGAGRSEDPAKRPIRLQDHGNPVEYRNIWIVEGVGTYHPPGVALSFCDVAETPAEAPQPTSPTEKMGEPIMVDPPAEEPKKDEPKKDEPKKEEPKKEEPKKEEPKKDKPRKQKPKKEKPEQDAKPDADDREPKEAERRGKGPERRAKRGDREGAKQGDAKKSNDQRHEAHGERRHAEPRRKHRRGRRHHHHHDRDDHERREQKRHHDRDR